MFDSMLFHRAGSNRSGRPRRGVNHVYGLPFLKPPISFPRALGGRFRCRCILLIPRRNFLRLTRYGPAARSMQQASAAGRLKAAAGWSRGH